MDFEDLEKTIIKKYGSKRKFAKAMGIKETNVNAMLRKPSKKTLIELERLGIINSNVNISQSGSNVSNTNGADMQASLNNSTLHQSGIDSETLKQILSPSLDYIKELKEQLAFLKSACERKDETIKYQAIQIQELLNKIKGKR